MKFLEQNLEDIIFNTDNELLANRGLNLLKNKKRQLVIGNYGKCDLIAWENQIIDYEYDKKTFKTLQKHYCLNIQLIELKQYEINYNSLDQILRYANGIKSYLLTRKLNFTIEIILIGETIKDSSILYFPNLINRNEIHIDCNISSFKLYTYDINFDGIRFYEKRSSGFVIEGFNFKKQNIVK